jgi:hypothetical protein
VNAWSSVCAYRTDDPAQAREYLAALLADVKNTPLGRDQEHRKALEIVFGDPLQHWFALPLSEGQASQELRPDLLQAALVWADVRA